MGHEKILLGVFIAFSCMLSFGANAQTLFFKKVLAADTFVSPGWSGTSPNGVYKVDFQAGDGNLVVYRMANGTTPVAVVWSTYTHLVIHKSAPPPGRRENTFTFKDLTRPL